MAKSYRIDVHHHLFPKAFDKTGYDPTIGFRFPEGNVPWSPEVSLRAMDALSIDLAVLSLPTGLPPGPPGPANRKMAREFNLLAARICEDHPSRFGFFATLPDPSDTEGALAEIAFALDELHADGINFSSSYGLGGDATYVGDDKYDPIWAELDRRQAVIFLHGTQTPSSTPYPHEFLGIPTTEVPNETYKAAAHLVVTGKKRRFPHVRIILSHLGGSTLFLAPRVAVLARHSGCALTPEEILADFATFYFDTALAAHEATLTVARTFLSSDRIMFGSDFPAVSKDMIDWYTKNVKSFYEGDPSLLEGVMSTNALKLMPSLQRRLDSNKS